MSTHRIACLQLNSQDNSEGNLQQIQQLSNDAISQGASVLALPENCLYMGVPGSDFPDETAAIATLQHLARMQAVWILIGSAHVPSDTGKWFNRQLLITPEGIIAAQYDKIHLFDVTLPSGERYTESARMQAGTTARTALTPWGVLGMSICYDVRFAHLYRTLAQAGANILAVPSAFTYTTGKAHWHTLLRARAIETGCYVIAPAQCGTHPGNRRTFGHSLIIDPWGEICAEASEATPQVILADIDTTRVQKARQMIPSLALNRHFTLDSILR